MWLAYLDWLSTENEECFCTLGQESRKLMHKYVLNLIGLLNLDANTDAVDAGLNENTLVLVSRNGERI